VSHFRCQLFCPDPYFPFCGGEKTEKLIANLNRLESIDKIDHLRPLFAT
jgi:hypothetical protein